MPSPISDATLARNIQTTLRDVSTLLNDASRVNTRAKTVYYKSIILFLASILEAQVHHFINRKCTTDPSLYQKDVRSYKPEIVLSKPRLGTSDQFYIAKEIITPRAITNITGSSKSMNEFCKEKGLLPTSLIRELEYSRIKRNTIHLQTLPSTSRSYTLAVASRIANAIDKMYEEIDNC